MIHIVLGVLILIQGYTLWFVSKEIQRHVVPEFKPPTTASLKRALEPKHNVLMGQRSDHGKGIG